MTTIDISIVIGRNEKLILPCLDSIYKGYKSPMEIFVTSNLSSNEILEKINEQFPAVHLVINEKKKGFAENHNSIIKKTSGEYILILNDDTVILNNAIERLVDYMEKHLDVATISPRLLNSDLSLRRSTYGFPNLLTTLLKLFGIRKIIPYNKFTCKLSQFFYPKGKSRFWEHNEICEVDSFGGSCMLVRRAAIEGAGLIGEVSLAYGEEIEWHYRFKKKGWKIIFYPEVEIIHYGGESTKNQPLFIKEEEIKGLLNFYRKHKNRLSYSFLRLIIIVISFFQYLFSLIVSNKEAANLHFKIMKIALNPKKVFQGKRKKKILISGWYGNNNVGDETILLGMLQSIREQILNADFLVFSDDPNFTKNNYKVESFFQWPPGVKKNPLAILHPLFWKYLFQLIKIIRQSDFFILGGGGLLQHNNFGVIPFWLSKLALAQLFRKPTMMYAIGAGLNHREMDKILIRTIGNRVKFITVRDEESKNNLINLGIKHLLINVTADPAFFIKPNFEQKDKIINFLKNLNVKVNREPLIGIVLLPLWSVGREKKKNILLEEQSDFDYTISKAIDILSSNLNTQIILLVENHREDKSIVEDVYRSVKNKDNVLIVDKKFTVDENLILISQLTLLISMRLHPLISASLVQTPFVGIITNPKIASFLSQIGQEEYGMRCEKMNPEDIYKRVHKALENEKQTKEILKSRVESLRQKAIFNTKLVKELFNE